MKREIEKVPKWLRELQLKSWEPEILLSGIVLYGLFQAPGLLDQGLAYMKVNFYGTTTDFDNLVAIFKVAIYWLTFGLILHLISRGIWVGMVGLSYTFPDGINFEKLRLSQKFKVHLERIPSMQSIIISLEKLCSSLFSISFMLFMSVIGAYFYILIVVILPVLGYFYIVLKGDFNIINPPVLSVYVIAVLIIGMIGLIDFLSLGLLKRFKWLSRIYWPVYRFLSVLTLARFYRPIYYSIVSNFSKWKIALFLLFFVVTSIYLVDNISGTSPGEEGFTRITMWNNSFGTAAYNGYYDDQNHNDYSLRAHIPSDIIRGNTLRLFVVARADLEDSIKSNCKYDSLVNETDLARRYVDLQCISEFFKIYVDDSLYENIQWKFHFKTHTNQKGFLTWINIRSLEEGQHQLIIKGPEGIYNSAFASIPFYHEQSDNTYFLEKDAQMGDEEDSYLKLKPVLPK